MPLAMVRAHPLLPFAAVAAGIGTFSTMDAAMKGASILAGVYSALLLRNLIGAALALPLWIRAGTGLPSRESLKVHALRSAVVACMAPLFFWALVRLPMAEAMAISFIAPLIALYLAALLLGETIHRRAVIASLLGLGGVMVIVAGRFDGGAMTADAGWGIAAVLTSAMFYAWNLVLQRQQALIAAPAEVALFQNLFVALILLVAAPWLLTIPSPAALRLITMAAALAVVSLLLLSWGYSRAEAQALVPIEYTGFIWAALLGWQFFDEPVTWATLAGVALIVVGSWVAMRGLPSTP